MKREKVLVKVHASSLEHEPKIKRRTLQMWEESKVVMLKERQRGTIITSHDYPLYENFGNTR